MNDEVYKPAGCKPLSELPDGQVRLLVFGPPFSGKTTGSLTFPNPVALSFDRKLTAHTHREDVFNVPFYDGAFCDGIIRRNGLATPPNRRDALLKWLLTEGVKLTVNQTAVLDNSTGIEEAFHTQYGLNPVISKAGEIDAFAEWRQKVDFFGDLFTALKAMHCNVVYICHEAPDRDKKGELNGKIRPLMTGQVADKMGGNFTDCFAAITIAKPNGDDAFKKMCAHFKIDEATGKEWVASTPPTHGTIYLWQTQSDELRSCGTTSLYNCPKYILADFKSFAKYRKQKLVS